jgi:hypothetical protein
MHMIEEILSRSNAAHCRHLVKQSVHTLISEPTPQHTDCQMKTKTGDPFIRMLTSCGETGASWSSAFVVGVRMFSGSR